VSEIREKLTLAIQNIDDISGPELNSEDKAQLQADAAIAVFAEWLRKRAGNSIAGTAAIGLFDAADELEAK